MKKLLFVITAAILAPIGAAQAGGWYLMIPPIIDHGDVIEVGADRPFSQWTQWANFDTAKACDDKKDEEHREFVQEREYRQQHPGHSSWDEIWPDNWSAEKKREKSNEVAFTALAADRGICVASDDPRLSR